MTKPGLLVLCIAPCIFSAALLSQDRVIISPRSRPQTATVLTRANLRSDVQLVQIPVMVTDLRGEPLSELRQNSFRLFEDDVERPIVTFSMADAPVSAMLVFDSSRSMRSRIVDARTAVEQFLTTRM